MDNGRIDQIIDKHQGKASSLVQILLEIQSENHWLPKEALDRVSERLELPLSQVLHTATFYKVFSLMPQARHEIHVCNGTSCHARGSQRIINTVAEMVGVEPGQTDTDLRFSLQTLTCLGCCSSGPAMEVDGKRHAAMTPARAEDVLKNCD